MSGIMSQDQETWEKNTGSQIGTASALAQGLLSRRWRFDEEEVQQSAVGKKYEIQCY